MKDSEVYNWLQEQQLTTAFVEWAATKSQKPISRATVYRAIKAEVQTARQRFAIRLAKEFYNEMNSLPATQ